MIYGIGGAILGGIVTIHRSLIEQTFGQNVYMGLTLFFMVGGVAIMEYKRVKEEINEYQRANK